MGRNFQRFSLILNINLKIATTTTNWTFLWRNENDPTNIYLSWFANQYRSGGNWANCHPHIVQCTLVGWEWCMLFIYIILIRDVFRNKNGIKWEKFPRERTPPLRHLGNFWISDIFEKYRPPLFSKFPNWS